MLERAVVGGMAASLTALSLLSAAAAAAAPAPPPGGPPASGPARDLTAQADALGREAALLVALEAFAGPAAARIATAVAPVELVGSTERGDVVAALEAADRIAAAELPALVGGRTSPDVLATLGELSPSDLSAVREQRPVSIDAEIYVRALDQLLRSNGQGSGQPPEIGAIAAALDDVQAEVPAEGGRTTSWLLLAGLAPLGAAAAWLLLRRRKARQPSLGSSKGPAPALRTAEPLVPAQAAPGSMHDLLDASRRLTGAASTGDIDRMVVREALGLVSAAGAALVLVDGAGLRLQAQSEPDLLVPAELEHGALRRVADTGQFHVQVSATEPAIRSLPAALVALPLVGGGRVEAVLVVVRPDSEPFSSAECGVLHAYGPVAAAALHSARQVRATIEDGLVDGLTGVGNRRRFDGELADALGAGTRTALIIADLDHFKAVNDTHGHPAGDALLVAVAAVLRTGVRPGDSVYRFGGEEFCVVLRDTDAAEAARVAERVREAVAGTPFGTGGAEPLWVTASFGVADAVGGSGAALLGQADEALYAAKRGGRNRVQLAGAESLS